MVTTELPRAAILDDQVIFDDDEIMRAITKQYKEDPSMLQGLADDEGQLRIVVDGRELRLDMAQLLLVQDHVVRQVLRTPPDQLLFLNDDDEGKIPSKTCDELPRACPDRKELQGDVELEGAGGTRQEAGKDKLLPPRPLLDNLRHLLQTRFPVLYTQVLEPTLVDLRQEHSAALTEAHPWKARCILLRGFGALAAAAVCQLGFSLLGRIAAIWQARSPK